MHVNHYSVARVLFGVGTAALCAGPADLSANRDGTSRPPATLHVLLTVAPELPDAARAELVGEATAVWDRAGVRLVFLKSTDGQRPAGSVLRVLVIPRPAVGSSTHERHVLGELLSFGKPGAIALVSIERARALVTSALGPLQHPLMPRDEQVGLVLGRVVAHEVGHYLLNTRTHARSGLMRAKFELAELVNHESRTFELDEDSTAWLHDPVSHGAAMAPSFPH